MDRPGTPAEAVRPLEILTSTRNLEWILRGVVYLGAAIAIGGSFLTWGGGVLPSDFVNVDFAPIDMTDSTERGVDSAYGWVVVAAAACASVIASWRLSGIALAAIPALVGGGAVVSWALFHDIFIEIVFEEGPASPDHFSKYIQKGVLVPTFGCGLMGAASLIALGVLLGRRMRDRAT